MMRVWSYPKNRLLARCPLLFLFWVGIGAVLSGAASAAPIDSLDFSTLPGVSEKRYLQLKAVDSLIWEDTPREKVFLLPATVYAEFLEKAVQNQWSAPEFYFDSSWLGLQDRVLLLDRNVLAAVDPKFEIGSLFPQKGTLAEDITFGEKVLRKGSLFQKEAILLKGDRIITLYPHPVTYHSKTYAFFSAQYELYRMNLSFRGSPDSEKIQITSFVGRNDGSQKLTPIIGPLGTQILSVTCKTPCQKLQVQTSHYDFSKKPVVIQKKRITP